MKDKPLSPRQERFVSFVLSGLSETQAAMKSGYAPASSRKASRISRIPAVKSAIQTGQATLREKTGYDVHAAVREIDARIQGALNSKSPNHMAAAKLVDLKCRIHGLVREKIEIVNVDLRRSLERAERRIIDVTSGVGGSTVPKAMSWMPQVPGDPAAEDHEEIPVDAQVTPQGIK